MLSSSAAQSRRRREPVKIPPAAPPAIQVSIISVRASDDGGIVAFDGHTITSIGDIAALEVNSGGVWKASWEVDWSGDSILFAVDGTIAPGMAWRVLSQPEITWDDDPTITLLVPASGTVV